MHKRKHIRWDETAGAAHNAQHQLPAMAAAYFAQGRQVFARKEAQSDLHALRLSTKRLRYTLELFRSCYGPGLRARMTSLRRLQQCLGEVNDCETAARVLADYSKKGPQRKQFRQFLAQRSLEKTAEFRRFWTEEFDAPGQEQWWTGYLARHTRQAARKR